MQRLRTPDSATDGQKASRRRRLTVSARTVARSQPRSDFCTHLNALDVAQKPILLVGAIDFIREAVVTTS